ncbi:MAG: Sir2 family NAD-dependent protein deacetylase [Deltaproteobacteria bacterium]|nr:Sir2 family NAD-dependent protein deacetylase [Deltaproteobacteria bacterium]
MNKEIAIISEKISETSKNVIFTGAGISTESGIPDYRSKGGIWDKFRPVYFDEFMSSKESRIEYWRRWLELYQDLTQAKPNPAHLAITKLHKMGLLEAVITQNIDGLHQQAGLPDDKIIELHGSTRRIRCMHCSKISSIQEAKKRLDDGDNAPECECGGYLKPDTISFGQAMPADKVEQAVILSKNSNFFMVVGSTLVVQPAAHMPIYAKNSGAFLAIINLSETPCDGICDVRINGKAGEVLEKIANGIGESGR